MVTITIGTICKEWPKKQIQAKPLIQGRQSVTNIDFHGVIFRQIITNIWWTIHEKGPRFPPRKHSTNMMILGIHFCDMMTWWYEKESSTLVSESLFFPGSPNNTINLNQKKTRPQSRGEDTKWPEKNKRNLSHWRHPIFHWTTDFLGRNTSPWKLMSMESENDASQNRNLLFQGGPFSSAMWVFQGCTSSSQKSWFSRKMACLQYKSFRSFLSGNFPLNHDLWKVNNPSDGRQSFFFPPPKENKLLKHKVCLWLDPTCYKDWIGKYSPKYIIHCQLNFFVWMLKKAPTFCMQKPGMVFEENKLKVRNLLKTLHEKSGNLNIHLLLLWLVNQPPPNVRA